jgi:putative colanic acid biosynthesis UDP-glucose lipid carrier transferase
MHPPGMKNSTAETVLETSTLQNADYVQTWDIVYKKKKPAPAVSIELNTPLHKRSNQIIKRFVDIVSSILLLMIFSWLLPIIAVLIKLDSKGPVFFLQKRNKKNGGVFTCLKFRTMIVNDEADILPAYENDQRVTQFGKLLRKYHFDEIPQLLNVLWGDMSLIGPRPHMFADNARYEEILDFYSQRHMVKPGITGLAQVMGYVGSTEDTEKMKQRVQLDIFYIRHWSPGMDTKIIFRTFLRMIGL